MIRLLHLLQRLGLMRPAQPVPAPDYAEHPEDERVVGLIIERLSEDETLRGALTDAGFLPVQNLVTALVPAAVSRGMRESSPEAAEEAVSRAARKLTRAIVEAAESGDGSELQETLVPPIISSEEVERARAVITKDSLQGATPDDRARYIAKALAASLEEPRA